MKTESVRFRPPLQQTLVQTRASLQGAPPHLGGRSAATHHWGVGSAPNTIA